MPKNNYLLLLGNTPDLSLAEIKAVVDNQAKLINKKVAQITTDQDADGIIKRLGGTVKVYTEIDRLPLDLSEDEIIDQVISYLAKQAGKKRLDFYLAQVGSDQLARINLTAIKQKLKNKGIASRFLNGRREGLSAALLLHQEVIELNLIYTDTAIILAQTLAVQDIDDWTKRDRQRPYAQRAKGMLPLKVARIMVNLAVGQTPKTKAKLLDPFCGSGSVLMEAAMINVKYLIGSDNDKKATVGTRENLSWLKTTYDLPINYEVHFQDATKLTLTTKVDYLVSEPFLGKQTPDKKRLPNIYLGLEKLYLGAFKNFTQLLNPGAKVVIIFPFWPEKPELDFKKLIDKLKQMGYTTISNPLSYSRKDAQVIRYIHQFEFKG